MYTKEPRLTANSLPVTYEAIVKRRVISHLIHEKRDDSTERVSTIQIRSGVPLQ